jgi:hypothetical protein
MPTTQRPNTPTPGKTRKSEDLKSKRALKELDREEGDDRESDADPVEIGDPVPEDQRKIKASRVSPGETGEDEDLPDDSGGEEGTSERH